MELRWIPDGRVIDGALESKHASSEAAKYQHSPKGSNAFIKDIEVEYKSRRESKLRMEAKQRSKTRGTDPFYVTCSKPSLGSFPKRTRVS